MNNSEGTMGSNLILVRYLIKWLLSVVNSYSADVIFAFELSTYCCNAQYELGEYSESASSAAESNNNCPP